MGQAHEVRLHRILHSNVQELLGDSLMEVMRCAEIKRVLSDIFLFKNLNEERGTTASDCKPGMRCNSSPIFKPYL